MSNFEGRRGSGGGSRPVVSGKAGIPSSPGRLEAREQARGTEDGTEEERGRDVGGGGECARVHAVEGHVRRARLAGRGEWVVCAGSAACQVSSVGLL